MTLNHNYGCFSGVGRGIAGNAQIHALNPIDYQPKTQTNSPNEPTDKIHLQNTIVPR